MRFLSYTTDLKDFVLNSVALGFIYDIDEMFYSISVPSRTQAAFNRLKPFKPDVATLASKLSEWTPFVEGMLWIVMLCLAIVSVLWVLSPFSSMYKTQMYEVLCS